jgi:hypothetical protein
MMIVADDQPIEFDPLTLVGKWQGEGSFLMPVTGMEISLEGEANFVYDSTLGYLRTAMRGETLVFTYTDSGHLAIDPVTDSLRWDIWDGFGRYVTYYGAVEGNKLTGRRVRGSRLYTIHTNFVGPDSIEFRLVSTEKDSTKIDRARFSLGRVR